MRSLVRRNLPLSLSSARLRNSAVNRRGLVYNYLGYSHKLISHCQMREFGDPDHVGCYEELFEGEFMHQSNRPGAKGSRRRYKHLAMQGLFETPQKFLCLLA
jgi:hypothetical protein